MMTHGEEIPYTQEEIKAMVKTIEQLRKEKKELFDKACDAYCEVCGHFPHTVPTHICRKACDYYSSFRKAMKE